MFSPVTKWATSIQNAGTIAEVVRKGVRIARTEKPGAVLIELPEDIAKHDTDATPIVPKRFRRPGPDDKITDRAFDMLSEAKNPVIIAGNGTVRKRASKQLRLLCEATGIGVLSTFMAKGAVDKDAPYCLYTVGLGAKDLPTLAIDAADLVITPRFRYGRIPSALVEPQRRQAHYSRRFSTGRDRSELQPGSGVGRRPRAHLVDAQRACRRAWPAEL